MRALVALAMASSLALLPWLTAGCGKGGSHDEPSDGPTSPTGGAPTAAPPTVYVSGRFVLGRERKPAVDAELWLVDRTLGSFAVKSLDAKGAFKIPVAEFMAGHRYSFHLVRDHVLLADVDFRAATVGVQPVVSYEGGYGFDLGEVALALDARGLVNRSAPGATSAVGGSFRTLADTDPDLNSLPLAAAIATLAVGVRLAVYDATMLREAFHRRSENAHLHAEALARTTRVGVHITARAKESLARALLHESGSWLAGSRLATPAETSFDAASRWSLTGFDIPKVDALQFQAEAYAGTTFAAHTLAVVRMQPKEGPLVLAPRLLGKSFATPPLVVAAALDGGSLETIDYASETAENGLTRPFCLQKKEVRLDIASARLSDDTLVHVGHKAQVDVHFDYYLGASDGKLEALTAAATNFAAAWQKSRKDSLTPSLQRSWTASPPQLRFDADSAEALDARFQITVPEPLFLTRIGGKNVDVIRLKITQRARGEAREATSVLWLKNGC